MISAEVERTLVKSPPELWAELGDPVALARHLGELGEIRITKVEPEKSVEWEAEAATGKVELKQSGWGTKVTLTITREARGTEAELVPESEPVREPVPAPVPEAEPMPEPMPAPVPEAEPPLGFFARLFKRRPRRGSKPVSEPPDAQEPSAEEIAAQQVAAEEAAAAQTAAERAAATEAAAAEQAAMRAAAKAAAAAEEAITAQTMELLTSVLDRLGAAHHRPFSRA